MVIKRLKGYLKNNSDIPSLKTGCLVKVVRNGERLWCIIKKITKNNYIVKVDSNAVTQNINIGDLLYVNKKFIFLK